MQAVSDCVLFCFLEEKSSKSLIDRGFDGCVKLVGLLDNSFLLVLIREETQDGAGPVLGSKSPEKPCALCFRGCQCSIGV